MRKCARWCGGGCTKAQYDAARTLARETAQRLGKGWRPAVWENIGWYAKATSPCRRINVHPHTDLSGKAIRFTAFLGDVGESGGRWYAHGKTASAAVRRVIGFAQHDLAKIRAVLTDVDRYAA